MAVEKPISNEGTPFEIYGMERTIKVFAPTFFHDLVNQTLTGWKVTPLRSANTYDIIISVKDRAFVIQTNLSKRIPAQTDLIDALNEFFLCLAYLVTAKTHGAQLLHCAAYTKAKQNVVVFGKKKAGKSSLVFEKAQSGETILADDLLIWLPKLAKVMCIGLPLRMRRPVRGLNAIKPATPQFIAGRKTAYAQKDAFKVGEAGLSFTPDKIYRLQNRKLVSVPFLKWPDTIVQHTISDDYTRLVI